MALHLLVIIGIKLTHRTITSESLDLIWQKRYTQSTEPKKRATRFTDDS